MCGIAGLVGLGGPAVAVRVREALRRLAHRGPDGEGLHEEDGAVLGIRRLAIIDLATGEQPIYNEDRSVAVVCNGELYNYVELFPELTKRGHVLQSKSDVNLLPHLYEERGADAFEPVRGMFAAAVWDARRRRLLLARDRVGKKPLFWAQVKGALAFASELPALLALLDAPPEQDAAAIGDFLRMGCVPHPGTVYRGVHTLPPGCLLEFSPGGSPSVRPYWAPTTPAPWTGTHEELIESLDARIREAVALRLRSDVPVGMFLSGGIDSSLVAWYAAQLGARDLLCFVVEGDDATLDEAPAARRTAARLGLPVETIRLAVAPIAAVEKVALLYGQPFADSSSVPTYFVARAAARHRKVVLNGDGGDEIFAGYRRYWAALALERLGGLAAPLGAFGALAGAIGGMVPRRSGAGFLLRTLRSLSSPDPDRYLAWTQDLLGSDDLGRVFPEVAAACMAADRRSDGLRDEPPSSAGPRAFQISDYRRILPDDLLSKMDIATMANSLEARAPLLDVPLAEFSWSVPEAWMLTPRRTKPLLRALARKHLTAEVAGAPKRGFEVPVGRWIATDLKEMVHDLLVAPDSRVAALGRKGTVRALVDGTDGFDGNRPQTVWALLMLELFLRAPTPRPAG